jgi:hypothetical protein
MIGCAASTRLPGCDQRVRVTAAASDERPGQGRGNPGAASPDHGAGAAAGYDPAAVLPWRPGVPGRPAAPAPTRRAGPVPAADPARDGAALAPGPAGAPPRNQVAPRAPRPAAHRPLDPSAGTAPGSRESVLGLPPHPRRTAHPRDQDCRLHRVGDPSRRRDRPGARAHLRHLGQLPPLPGRGAACLRLLRDRHLNRGPPVRAGGHRARQPADPDPGRDPSSRCLLGRPGREEPRHGSPGRREPGAVLDPGP